MNRILICLALAVAAGPIPFDAKAADPPNIVMIVSDDQAWTDYGFMGHDTIRTPHLDRLARESVVFPSGYVPTALCRPSLATLVTGLYAHQHGITGNDPAPRDRNGEKIEPGIARQQRLDLIANIQQVPTLPRWLAERQYLSFQSGKWWEGNYREGGFTHGMTRGFPAPGGRHGDDGLKIGREGLQPVFDFIRDAQTAQQPFFIWYAPFLPHTPHNPPPRLLEHYQQEGRPPELARYYAMCEWFDETCGELLDHLDQQGLRDNTVVVYVTDNGWIQRTAESETPAGWNREFAPRSKQTPYEGGVRTPILFRWPGKWAPRTEPERISSIDLVPTLLATAEIEIPESLPGENLLPALAKNAPVPGRPLFGETFAHDVADLNDPSASLLFRWVIDGDWKLIVPEAGAAQRYAGVHADIPREPQLFRIDRDPHETRNEAIHFPDRVAAMQNQIDRWWAETPAPRVK